MVATTALFLLALSGGADSDGAQGVALARGGAFEASPWLLDMRLRSPLLDHPHAWTAQAATRATDATPVPAPAPAAQVTPHPAPVVATPATESAPEGGACTQCDIDCDTCRESDRQARYLLRRRERNLRTHRGFALAAWGGLAVTEVLGTLLAINRPTWFGDGACAGGSGIGGQFGCGSGLTSLHETFAFITTGLYTTAGVIAATAPDPDNAAAGSDPASSRLRLHKTMAWVHASGMILMPLLGILSAYPQAFGITDSNGDFSRGMRSVHTIVGYTTFVAFSFSAVLELF